MSGTLSVEVPMPVMKVRYTATVLQVKRASGLEYMMMKMVEAGRAAGPDLDIAQMMGVLSMHSDLFPLVAEELERLRRLGMVAYSVSKLEPRTPIRRISVTETGASLLAKNIASSEKKRMERVLVYSPWRKEKFSDDRSVPFLDDRRMMFGNDRKAEAIAYVDEHRLAFGVDQHATITSPKVEVTGLPSGNVGCGLEMYFDRAARMFRLAGAQDLDMDYVREEVSGSALLRKLPDSVFEIPAAPFEVKRWSDPAPGDGLSYMLPCDFETGRGILFHGPALSKVVAENRAKLPEEFGCDAVVITSRTEGRMVWFVRAPVSVEGFEGERQVRLVAMHKMSRKEIDGAVDGLLAGKRVGRSDELKAIYETSCAIGDGSVLADRAVAAIDDKDVESMKRVLTSVCSLEGFRWHDALGKGLEGLLCQWIDGGLDIQDAQRFVSVCSRREVPLSPDRIMPRALKAYGALEAADWAYSVGFPPESFEKRSDVADAVAKAIASGEPPSGTSKELEKVRVAASRMKYLVGATGISSSKDYAYEPGREDPKEIIWAAADLGTALSEIRSRFSVSGSAGFRELERLSSIYVRIADALRRDGKIRRSTDLAAETNALLFFSEAERMLLSKLRLLFGDLPREDLVSRLKSSGLVPMSDNEDLDALLRESSRCRKNDVSAEVPPERRRAWAELVFEIVRLTA